MNKEQMKHLITFIVLMLEDNDMTEKFDFLDMLEEEIIITD